MFDISPRTQKSRSTVVLDHFNPDGPGALSDQCVLEGFRNGPCDVGIKGRPQSDDVNFSFFPISVQV